MTARAPAACADLLPKDETETGTITKTDSVSPPQDWQSDFQDSRSDSDGRNDAAGGAVMTSINDNLREVVDELTNALQTAVVLAGELARSLKSDVHDADALYASIARATAALQRLRPSGDGQ